MKRTKGQSADSASRPVLYSGKGPVERTPYASQIGVILTEKCNIKCRHCINECSPVRNEDLDWGVLESFIKQAADSTFVDSIEFSGGEPFIDITRLENAVSLCREYGLAYTLTTNGFWASNVSSAKKLLKKLKNLKTFTRV